MAGETGLFFMHVTGYADSQIPFGFQPYVSAGRSAVRADLDLVLDSLFVSLDLDLPV